MQLGKEELLRADRVHFFADDALDLEQRTPRQREVTVEARRQLPHVSGAQQKLVANDLGLGRRVTQGRDVQLTPTHKDSTSGGKGRGRGSGPAERALILAC